MDNPENLATTLYTTTCMCKQTKKNVNKICTLLQATGGIKRIENPFYAEIVMEIPTRNTQQDKINSREEDKEIPNEKSTTTCMLKLPYS